MDRAGRGIPVGRGGDPIAKKPTPAAAGALASAVALLLLGTGAAPAGSHRPHDLHITYGNLAVEGATAVYQIRVFRDDLVAALAGHAGESLLDMAASPEVDAIFLDYMEAHVRIRADGVLLEPALLASGEDELDREPVWWYRVQYRADAPVRQLSMVNTVLFELFDDQRNILRVVHFPGEARRTYYFAPGEDSIHVSFPLQ